MCAGGFQFCIFIFYGNLISPSLNLLNDPEGLFEHIGWIKTKPNVRISP